MQKRSRRITDVANSMLGLRWYIGGQDTRRVTRNVACRAPGSDGPQSKGAESSYAGSMSPTRAPESNIEIIFADWLDAMRRGDLETMAGRLAPDVVHQGVRPELICRNREQVIDMVGRRAGRVPPVEAIELIAAGDHVVMTVRGAGIGPPVDDDEDEARGQATVVYTLADGKIVRMHDYLHRAEALEAAGASSVAWD
jgi:ketosteroid isomerase-like protein